MTFHHQGLLRLACLLSASASNLKCCSRSSLANVYVHQCARKGPDQQMVSQRPCLTVSISFSSVTHWQIQLVRCLRSTKKDAAHTQEAQHAPFSRRSCSFPVSEFKLFVLLRAKMKSSPLLASIKFPCRDSGKASAAHSGQFGLAGEQLEPMTWKGSTSNYKHRQNYCIYMTFF